MEEWCDCCEKNTGGNICDGTCSGYKTIGAKRIPILNMGDIALFRVWWRGGGKVLCKVVAPPNIIGLPGKDMVQYLVREAANEGAHAKALDEDNDLVK